LEVSREISHNRADTTPVLAWRLLAAFVVALVAAAYSVRLARVMPYYGTDFDPVRAAARLVIHHQDPYELIGPGRAIFWNYRVRYPMPAILLAIPFVIVPIVVARAVFVATTSGLLAFLITRHGWFRLFVFASASWWFAVGVAQWSPMMLAAMLAPALGFAVAAKPNLGLVVIAASRDQRSLLLAILGAGALVILSFLAMPSWFIEWRQIARDTPDVSPLIALTGGPLLLLAILKWRRPEARLLLAFALVPMNPGLYEGVLLFAIPRSMLQAALLATTSWFVDPLVAMQVPAGAWYVESTRATGRAMLLCMYLPALVMLLRRPNVGAVPEWVDRLVSGGPKWLRGTPT
jgi:hypothetical protein